MLLNFHFPQYFTQSVRKEIGELYAASTIGNLALSIVMIFEPIFLYAGLGFSVSEVLGFMALVYLVYVVSIPLGARVASQVGYRHAIAYSIPFQVGYWALLFASRHYLPAVVFAAVAFGLQKSLYWPAFHAIMARFGDRGQVGREFGAVEATISVTHILGPFLGGYLSEHYGVVVSFIVSAAVYCASAIPLLMASEVFVPKPYRFSQTRELYRKFPKKAFGYFGFGEELLVLTVWPIFIYTVVKGYESTGLLATAASFVAAALALVMGKVSDRYTKRVLVKVGAFFTALVWLARLGATSFWSTFAVDSLSRTAKEVVFVPLSTLTYIRAEQTHILPYAVFFEQSLALGKLLTCIAGIVLFQLTGSFVVLFMLAAAISLLYVLA